MTPAAATTSTTTTTTTTTSEMALKDSKSQRNNKAQSQQSSTFFQDRAIRKLARLIALKTLAPLALLAWTTTQSWTAVALSLAFMPLLVFVQSAVGLILFRIVNGTPPIPVTPRHGVVVVNPHDRTAALPMPKDDGTNKKGAVDQEDADFYEMDYEHTVSRPSEKLDEAMNERPLRLLVVGDSVAIGVGQGQWPTPVMPETLARTLSKKMGGRAVYWTCHGATGASIGWVIRELERGVEYLNLNNNTSSSAPPSFASVGQKVPSSCSSTESEDSSLDDSASETSGGVDDHPAPIVANGMIQGDAPMDDDMVLEWRRRLDRHRERFEPDLSGFYDIVVCITGINDAKSALLPFLLTGEDSELRRQAQARGSSFSHDLHLLLETLGRKMQLRVQWLRTNVLQPAAESVLERVETSMERIAPGSTARFHKNAAATASLSSSSQPNEPKAQQQSTQSSQSQDRNRANQRYDDLHHSDKKPNGRHPLVVFPGLSNKELPVFSNIPVCWYGGPPVSFYGSTAVDILEAHKKDMACSFPNDILFVPAPVKAEGMEYVRRRGPYFSSRTTEDVLLSVRDLSPTESRMQEERLRAYYNLKGRSAYSNSPFRKIRDALGIPIPAHFKLTGVDGLHPNDVGFDFWGRHLGHHIYQEWQKREERFNSNNDNKSVNDNGNHDVQPPSEKLKQN